MSIFLSKTPNARSLTALVCTTAICTLMLSACGGSSSSPSGGTGTVTPPTTSGPNYTKGTFANASSFVDQCAAPRTGTNPATNSAYPDRQGTTTLENHWLRSWSNNTYLWYSEIPDQNPANFTDRIAYFDTLKTSAVTASGTDVDQFHFNIPTDEYYQSASSGASASYGAKFRLISSSVPREVRIAYVQAGSAAANAPASLARGAEIITINGVDVVNDNTQAGVNTLNDALFPDAAGQSFDFVVRDFGATTTRSFSMTTEIVTFDPVPNTKIINTASGPVGYILFNTFGTVIAEQAIFDAVTDMKAANINNLVLDLRYNGGGYLDISSELGFMIAGNTAEGKVFDSITFNDKHTTTNPVTGASLSADLFHTTAQGFTVDAGTALPTLDLPKIYVLSTGNTCSASEALINGLRGVDVEVVLVGTTTCGKPYGFYPTDNCGETYFTVQFKGANAKGFGDYSDGFVPSNSNSTIGESIMGCAVNDDFDNQLGDENEALLSAALGHIETGNCPTPPTVSSKSASTVRDQDLMSALGHTKALKNKRLLEQSLIIARPVGHK